MDGVPAIMKCAILCAGRGVSHNACVLQ